MAELREACSLPALILKYTYEEGHCVDSLFQKERSLRPILQALEAKVQLPSLWPPVIRCNILTVSKKDPRCDTVMRQLASEHADYEF